MVYQNKILKNKTAKLNTIFSTESMVHTVYISYKDQFSVLTETADSQASNVNKYLKDNPKVAAVLLAILITIFLYIISWWLITNW